MISVQRPEARGRKPEDRNSQQSGIKKQEFNPHHSTFLLALSERPLMTANDTLMEKPVHYKW
ncbi:hypothetical protein DDZ13_10390 [Coraliomargarita sinensis]|uniref:Uncharacterized protein n=1 Tax=Coraliomargarita sinensis TaxID=2174842 RepID=A0A317ZE73_9BACT|nr:hypothetical protein DDZ13_10390 [Coraliomargarita sinensis]